jgi:hypothetical protein
MYRNSIAINKTWAPVPNDSALYCRNTAGNYFSDAKNLEYTPDPAQWAGSQWSNGTGTYNGNYVEVCINPGYPAPSNTSGKTRNSDHWRNHWVRTADSVALAMEANGFWVDNINVPYGGKLPDPWVERDWCTGLTSFMDSAKKNNPSLIYLINTSVFHSYCTWYYAKNTSVDGLNNEGFLNSVGGAKEWEWRIYVSKGLELDRLGKAWVAMYYATDYYAGSTPGTQPAAIRMFYLASYLMGKGSYSYFDQEAAFYLNWYPEFSLQVGYPLENKHLVLANYNPVLPQNQYYVGDDDSLVSVYRGGGSGDASWYYRRYSNALVVVNPTESITFPVNIQQLEPARTFFQATGSEPVGSSNPFMVSPAGAPKGKIVYTPAQTSYQLGPTSALILIADTGYVNADTVFPAPTAVERAGELKDNLQAETVSADPNPFNPSVTIRYRVDRTLAPVRINIFDMNGKLVKGLVEMNQPRGGYQVNWDGTNNRGTPMPSGIYLVKCDTGNRIACKKLNLVK